MTDLQGITSAVETALRELVQAGNIGAGHIVVVGVSTSEVSGHRIGTSGTEHIAAGIYKGVDNVRREKGFHAAFQCCEHLNRALVVERELLHKFPWEEVASIPIPKAGGSMAAYAYLQMKEPCLVESIQANAGIDIGETLIGMHLRRVAVPFRTSVRQIGEARVNAAYTRPKLIGGARAVYTLGAKNNLEISHNENASDDCHE
jgi:uncharacterized protein (TIGR01440 family)